MWPQEERRRAIRVKKQLEAQYEVAPGKWDTTFIKNFSSIGMLITTTQYYPLNASLTIRLKLPTNPFGWVEIKGRVVQCDNETYTTYGNTSTTICFTRIEFSELKVEGKEMIEQYVHWFITKGGGAS